MASLTDVLLCTFSQSHFYSEPFTVATFSVYKLPIESSLPDVIYF